VALLLIMFIISYWVVQGTTQPFILLRDKLKSLSLEKENELLSWQRNDEIGELIKQYNTMVLDLKESRQNLANAERTEAWREMAKQVAHDIKNPLTPMKLNLQYLQKAIDANDDELYMKFQTISKSLIEQINSLTEMANNFGNFAKAPDASPQVLDMNYELQNLIQLYRATDFVEINAKFNVLNAKLWMDKNHFTRAIGNIIKNAIQAIPQGKAGFIEIILDTNDKRNTLIIKDNGIGIPKETEQKIFIPNFSTKTSGSGIGLSIAKTMIENAGGTISFYSVVNKGTTFIVEFPVYNKT
jgi:nitrogen fixation/metabolism regulation signal transduction histidine kinase